MFVHRTWYWAGWSHEIKSKPMRRKFLGKQILLFRDSEKPIKAMGAMCPHRGADLSQGKVIDDCIQCPFHGLKFDTNGRCVEIPSQPPSKRIPRTAKVDVFPVVEKDGIVWIWMDSKFEPDHQPPVADIFDPQNTDYAHKYWTRHQKGDFVVTVETAIEDSHLPYLHKSTFNFPVVRVPPYKFEHYPDGRGFAALYDREGAWWIDTDLPKSRKLKNHVKRIGDTQKAEWFMGGHVRQHFSDGTSVGIFVTPSDETELWFAVTAAKGGDTKLDKFLNKAGLSGLVLKLLANKIFDEDEVAVSDLILTDRPGGLERPVFQVSDSVCAEFRKMYRRFLKQEGREWATPDAGR